MKKDAIEALIERIDTDFGEDFKVSNGSPAQTAHAPEAYEVNRCRPALYLNELIEDGHCLCGLPLFFPENPRIDVIGLDNWLLDLTIVRVSTHCRRVFHHDYERVEFDLFMEEEYLLGELLYNREMPGRTADGFTREDIKYTLINSKIRSTGYKKLMSLFTEDHPPLTALFEYFNKFLDTTGTRKHAQMPSHRPADARTEIDRRINIPTTIGGVTAHERTS